MVGAPRRNFYTVSQGSVEELTYYLLLARDLGYTKSDEPLRNELKGVGAMLNRLVTKTLAMDPGRFA